MSKPETVTIKYDAWNKDQIRLTQLQARVVDLEASNALIENNSKRAIELKQLEIDGLHKTQTHGILNLFRIAFAHTKDKENVFS